MQHPNTISSPPRFTARDRETARSDKEVARLLKRAAGRLGQLGRGPKGQKLTMTALREMACGGRDQSYDKLVHREPGQIVMLWKKWYVGATAEERRSMAKSRVGQFFHYGPRSGFFEVDAPCDVCIDHDTRYKVAASCHLRGLNFCRACETAVEKAQDSCRAFSAAGGRAVRLGLPTAYHRDLWLHDRVAMTTAGNRPFVWCIGESGTTLVWIDAATLRRQDRGWQSAQSFARTLRESRPHAFRWDGVDLVEVASDDELIELLSSGLPRQQVA